jgi:signal recognition particle GTPase
MAKGLYANIQAKRKRIAAGSGEKMRKVGSKGAPTAKNFKQASKTAKKRSKK